MNKTQLPETAFVDPHGDNREQIDGLFARAVEIVVSVVSGASSRPPLPEAGTRSDLASIPKVPVSDEVVLQELHELLVSSMNAAHPGYIGHMDSMPTTASILGEFASAMVNNNMLSAEMSPAFSHLEPLLLREFAGLFGLPAGSGGVLASGGSVANLQALAVARNAAFGCLEEGVVGLGKRPAIFASDAAHTSLQKAAMLLGLGTSSVIKVPTNAGAQMDESALEREISRIRRAGRAPFCVVGTAGTTVTGNVDPLAKVGTIARKHGLWFHVDAAYGGALAFSDKHRYRLTGIELADSVTFNPQKWLYVAKTCAMVLFRDANVMQTAFRIGVPYMRDQEDLTNLGEVSVQGTRHAEVLKLWLSLRHLGRRGYEQLIDESYLLTERFVREVEKRPFLEMASKPEMNLICFRSAPGWIPSEKLDRWNVDLQTRLLLEGNVFLSLPLHRGHRWLRAVVLNPYTDRKTITNLFRYLDEFHKLGHEKLRSDRPRQ